MTAVARSHPSLWGGTQRNRRAGALCQDLSVGTCVKALSSTQCSTRYCVYSSGLVCLFQVLICLRYGCFIHSLLLEVKHRIIYTPSLETCILFEVWCCADVLEIQGKLKNNCSVSMTIFLAREAINLKKHLIEWYTVRGEMTLLETVLPARGVRSGHSNDYLISSSFLSIAVGLEQLHYIWLPLTFF